MSPTTAPHVEALPGSPRHAPDDGPPLPRPRRSPTEPVPTTDAHPPQDSRAPHAGTDDAVTATAQELPEDETGAWALVKAAQTGNMSAFGDLFDRYYDVVFRYVLFRMGDRTLAEDITQETFVRALRRITSVSYQGRDIGAWFVTIARNLIFDHVKSSRYRLEQTTSEIVELSPSTNGPEQQVLDGATNDELLRCVRKLNPDQQECIQLRFLQGLSVAETAQIMDRNEGAVKALQHRAVRRLAQLLPEGLR
ncbi:sigma-70 family RNA polymerase sigma factor [Pseudonocardia sp. TRM90224]|uniref:sigma-70 family RNA polymerase sigma factor n=1 Tax=Pseudonocardia sp. TRM90224 TaxID=2812678 RepID=UPI0035A989FB